MSLAGPKKTFDGRFFVVVGLLKGTVHLFGAEYTLYCKGKNS